MFFRRVRRQRLNGIELYDYNGPEFNRKDDKKEKKYKFTALDYAELIICCVIGVGLCIFLALGINKRKREETEVYRIRAAAKIRSGLL